MLACKVTPAIKGDSDKSISRLKIPQGITEEQFAKASTLIKENAKIKEIGGEIFVQGSRAKGTAKPTSDIDFGVRVSVERFDQLIKECFGIPNPGSQAEKTMLHAIETGKIQYGEIKLAGFKIGKSFKKLISDVMGKIDIDFSVIKANGPFDVGPFINL